METTSTVGYGDMHPQTIYGHVVATVANFVGLLLLAVMTGLVFARFSRPRARIIFAKYPVLTQHNGVMTLIFRMANARSNFISEARAKLWMLSANVTEEGRRLVGFDQMPLTKSENPSFALSWTLFHPINEHSPLFGMDKETLAASEINFILSIVGFDVSPGRPSIHATSSPPRTCAGTTNMWTSFGSTTRACATSTMRRSTQPNWPLRLPQERKMTEASDGLGDESETREDTTEREQQ